MNPFSIHRRNFNLQLLAAAFPWFPLPAGGIPLIQEDELGAALLLSFMRFTEWPPVTPSDSRLLIGVFAQEGLRDALMKLSANKSVRGRPIEVRGVRHPMDIKQCDVVHFGSLQGKALAGLLAPAQGQPKLTFGESDRFLWEGGMIRLFAEDGRLSFEVQLEALAESGLTIRSQLLRLGHVSKISGQKAGRRKGL